MLLPPDLNIRTLTSLLAFDFGTKNIGLAFGQVITQTARELPPLPAREGIPDWHTIEKLLREWRPDALLVGLPINMDGSASELSQKARKFGNRLHGRFGLPVIMADERLSTFEAKAEARGRGHRGDYGKNPVDSIAARLILESWLTGNAAQGTE